MAETSSLKNLESLRRLGERLASARARDAELAKLAKVAASDQVRAAIARCQTRGWSWRKIAGATGLTRDRVRKLDTGIGFPMRGELELVEALAADLERSPDVSEHLRDLERIARVTFQACDACRNDRRRDDVCEIASEGAGG